MEARADQGSSLQPTHTAIPLFYREIPTPKYIKMSDRPPGLGGKVKKIPLATCLQRTGMKGWLNASLIYPTAEDKKISFVGKSLNQQRRSVLLNQITENQNRLVLSHMGEVNWGLFALRSIPPNTPIALYTGVIRKVSDTTPLEQHQSAYGLSISNQSQDTVGTINASEYGNFSRFTQAAPEPLGSEEAGYPDFYLSSYRFDASIDPRQIAVSNLEVEIFSNDKQPICVLKTGRNGAEKHSILCWNYSLLYWVNLNVIPKLFTMQGAIVDPRLYRVEEIFVRVEVYENEPSPNDPDQATIIPHSCLVERQTGDFFTIRGREGDWRISKTVCLEEYDKHPYSPYLILHLPRAETFRPSLPIAKPARLPSVKQSGLYQRSKSTAIAEQIKRIVANIDQPIRFGYNSTTEKGVLQCGDENILINMASHFARAGIAAEFGDKSLNAKPTLILTIPSLAKLKKVPAIAPIATPFNKRLGSS